MHNFTTLLLLLLPQNRWTFYILLISLLLCNDKCSHLPKLIKMTLLAAVGDK